MIEHLLVLAACLPLLLGLGAWNSRVGLFSPGEIRFWGVCIFVTVEFLYLGIS